MLPTGLNSSLQTTGLSVVGYLPRQLGCRLGLSPSCLHSEPLLAQSFLFSGPLIWNTIVIPSSNLNPTAIKVQSSNTSAFTDYTLFWSLPNPYVLHFFFCPNLMVHWLTLYANCFTWLHLIFFSKMIILMAEILSYTHSPRPGSILNVQKGLYKFVLVSRHIFSHILASLTLGCILISHILPMLSVEWKSRCSVHCLHVYNLAVIECVVVTSIHYVPCWYYKCWGQSQF